MAGLGCTATAGAAAIVLGSGSGVDGAGNGKLVTLIEGVTGGAAPGEDIVRGVAKSDTQQPTARKEMNQKTNELLCSMIHHDAHRAACSMMHHDTS